MRLHAVILPSTALVLLALLGMSACETTFDAFEENDRYYSITGYLDAGVDTQFIRIEPLRDSLLLGTTPIEVEVTLEHLATGVKKIWNDSLFRFADEVYAHNFWSAEPVQPRETYRLEVRQPDGLTSTALVTLPDTFPTPIPPQVLCMSLHSYCLESWVLSIDVKGIKNLAAATAVYHYLDPDPLAASKCRIHKVPYWREAMPTQDGFRIRIEWRRDLEAIADIWTAHGRVPFFANFDLFVAVGNDEWPAIAQLDQETLFLPDVATNVEHGVGFVGGVLSKNVYVFGTKLLCE